VTVFRQEVLEVSKRITQHYFKT